MINNKSLTGFQFSKLIQNEISFIINSIHHLLKSQPTAPARKLPKRCVVVPIFSSGVQAFSAQDRADLRATEHSGPKDGP